MLSRQAVIEFQELYFQQYGRKLSSEEALELGTRLIGFVKAVYGGNLPKLKDVDTSKKKEDN
jgi:hypothetical protein